MTRHLACSGHLGQLEGTGAGVVDHARHLDGKWAASITPDAGMVKSGGYRDLPFTSADYRKRFQDLPKGFK
ncbi:MAG: hypothetical protein ACSHWY_02315 [Octadecabacter sp.]